MLDRKEFEKMKVLIGAKGLLVQNMEGKVLQKFSDGVDIDSLARVIQTIMKSADRHAGIFDVGELEEILYYTGKDFKFIIAPGKLGSEPIVVTIILHGRSNLLSLRGFLFSLLKKKGLR